MTAAVALLLLASLAPEQTSLRLGNDGYRVGDDFLGAIPSPDGRFFGVRTYFGSFHVLEAATGRVIQSWDGPWARQMAFDWNGRICVLDDEGCLGVYDIETGRCVRRMQVCEPSPFQKAEFLCDGRLLRLNSDENQFTLDRVISVPTGMPVDWVGTRSRDIRRTVFSSDGRRRALFVRQRVPFELLPLIGWRWADLEAFQLRVDDPRTGREVGRIGLPIRSLHAAAFLPGGHQMLVLGDPAPLLVDLEHRSWQRANLEGWEAAPDPQKRNEQCAFQTPDGGDEPPWESENWRLAVSPDGRRVAYSFNLLFEYGWVREWDLETGRLLGRWPSVAPGEDRVGYTPAGRLRRWNSGGPRLNLEEGPVPFGVPPWGHRLGVCGLHFNADGSQLRSLDQSGLVLDWELPTGRLVRSRSVPAPTRWSDSIWLHPDGSQVLRKGSGCCVAFDLERARVCSRHEGLAGSGTFSPDGRWYIRTDQEESPLILRDLQRGRSYPIAPEDLWPIQGRTSTLRERFDGAGTVVALGRNWVPEGDTGVLADLAILRLVDRKVLWRSEGASLECFTPDGSAALVWVGDRLVHVDLATGRCRDLPTRNLGRRVILWILASSADGRLLLVEADSGVVPNQHDLRLIELATGTVRQRWLESSPPWNPVCFSRDGKWLAYALSDATIRLRSTAMPAAPLDPAALWRGLASEDAAVAGIAVEQLVARPDAARFLSSKMAGWLGHAPGLEDAVGWLPGLDADDPDERERARARFRQLERPTLAALAGSVVGSIEVRRSLRGLLEESETETLSPDVLRQLRAVEVLERLGTGEGRELLARLRDGAALWDIRREAGRALRRAASLP
jgi:WD40 repeat protein